MNKQLMWPMALILFGMVDGVHSVVAKTFQTGRGGSKIDPYQPTLLQRAVWIALDCGMFLLGLSIFLVNRV